MSRHRVRAHQALTHRLERDDLLLGQIGEADRLARIHQRMQADQILHFLLGARVERAIGGTHVGEFGVGAP